MLFFEFFCGIFLALCILNKQKKASGPINGIRWTIAGGIGIAAVFIIHLTNNTYADKKTLAVLLNNFILPVFIGLLYYGLIYERSLFSRFLSGRLVGLLGLTSYAFYLVHIIVIDSIAKPFIAPYFHEHYNLYVLLIFILTQAVAYLIYKFYEEPLNRFIRKNFSTKS